MKREGRLIQDSHESSNFGPPNFRTVQPLPVLLGGLRRMPLYTLRPTPVLRTCTRFSGTLAGSPGTEGVSVFLPVPVKGVFQVCLAARRMVRLSSELLALLLAAHAALRTEPTERRLGFELALSGHHFIRYARKFAETLEAEAAEAARFPRSESDPRINTPATNLG
jgi:hypothetical protein